MIKVDENGKYTENEDGIIKNIPAIQINNELSNKKELFEMLQNTLIEAFNENKDKDKFTKEIDLKEIEKGELKISSFNIPPRKSKTKNDDFQLKSSSKAFIGAFQVNGINLFYDRSNNDYNFSQKYQYESTKQNGEKTKRQFINFKDSKTRTAFKNALYSAYKERQKEFKEMLNTQKPLNQNVEQNSATQTQHQ